MKTKLFHTIILCGAALGSLPAGCGAASDEDDRAEMDETADRCVLPDGTCDARCTPLFDGSCLDPCFVHTDTCSADCVQDDGSCGWPPTK